MPRLRSVIFFLLSVFAYWVTLLKIWRHLKAQGISSADTTVELKQGGRVRLRLEFDSSTPPNGRDPSLNGEQVGRSVSIPSPSRFNLRALRSSVDHDDS